MDLLNGSNIESLPNVPETPETAPEQEAQVQPAPAENREVVESPAAEQPAPELPSVPEVAPRAQTRQVSMGKDELYENVENALVDKKMMVIWKGLPESMKPKFKAAGEELAREISNGIRKGNLKPHKALKGIRKWLGMIPDVERSYLAQEASLDLDKVLNIAEEAEHAQTNTV